MFHTQTVHFNDIRNNMIQFNLSTRSNKSAGYFSLNQKRHDTVNFYNSYDQLFLSQKK